MKRQICFALPALALLVGCTETVDSQNIKTPGISATIEATAESDTSTQIVATLQVGGPSSNTYVNLEGGDQLFAAIGDNRVAMQAQDEGVYTATFKTAAAETNFTVDLQRVVEADAPANNGTLPSPFDLTVGASAVSRTADLTFTWTPSGSKDTMHLELSGTCIFNESLDVPGDTGTFTLAGNTLKPTNSMMAETCDVSVEMTRTREGTTDPGLDPESSFSLRQIRTSKFTSTP